MVTSCDKIYLSEILWQSSGRSKFEFFKAVSSTRMPLKTFLRLFFKNFQVDTFEPPPDSLSHPFLANIQYWKDVSGPPVSGFIKWFSLWLYFQDCTSRNHIFHLFHRQILCLRIRQKSCRCDRYRLKAPKHLWQLRNPYDISKIFSCDKLRLTIKTWIHSLLLPY